MGHRQAVRRVTQLVVQGKQIQVCAQSRQGDLHVFLQVRGKPEALFRAGLSPKRTAATVQGGRAEKLACAIRDVLMKAIAAGGSSLRDHRQPSGELGYFQHSFAVYGREGEACPGCACDLGRTGGIRRITQSSRSTFYCAHKQR